MSQTIEDKMLTEKRTAVVALQAADCRYYSTFFVIEGICKMLGVRIRKARKTKTAYNRSR